MDGTTPAATPLRSERRPWYRHLYAQVLLAITLGVLVGHFFPAFGIALKPLGDAFIKLVKMVIAPVIFLTVSTGIARSNDSAEVGRVFGKAFLYFISVSTLALVIGLVVANVVQPGAGIHIDPATLDPKGVAEFAAKSDEQTITGFLLNIIPTTPITALASGEILQALFVAALVGIAMTLVGEPAAPFLRGLESATAIVFRLVDLLMRLAPIGAFGAMAFTTGQFGIASLTPLLGLVATFYLTAALFVVVVLGTIARLAGFSILALLRYIKDELILVLGTSSSEAALPRLLEKLVDAGCRRDVVGLVLPAGYSFNLDGTNIYMTLAALFIAQALGVDLSLHQQLLLMAVAVISSKGAAGVTGSGFIILAATLSVVPAVPVAGMAIILGVDRFMSECRALTNTIGNAVATIVIARWEGALDQSQLDAALSRRPTVTPLSSATPASSASRDPVTTPRPN
jgi:aerobic C4-dicarboxylate transport protein